MDILREEIKIFPVPALSLTVCTNETTAVTATVEREVTYRDRSDPAGTLRTMRRTAGFAANVRAVSDDPSIGDIAPLFQPAGPPNGVAAFKFTGKKPGRTTVRLSETANANFTAQTIDIAVDDCYYLITAVSKWQMPDGFMPRLTSLIVGAELRPAPTPGMFLGTAQTQNIAVGLPMGGCIPNFDVPPSTVMMTGTVAQDGYLTLELNYLPVVAHTIVDCIIIGGTTNTATPRIVRQRTPAFQSATLTESPHILDAQFAVPGDTTITLTLVRIPS